MNAAAVGQKLFGTSFIDILYSSDITVLKKALAEAFNVMPYADKLNLVEKLTGFKKEFAKQNISYLKEELENYGFSIMKRDDWYYWQTDDAAGEDFAAYEDALIDAFLQNEANK